jgi:hypothetical protein
MAWFYWSNGEVLLQRLSPDRVHRLQNLDRASRCRSAALTQPTKNPHLAAGAFRIPFALFSLSWAV